MAGKGKTESRAAERAKRLAELKKQAKAQERRRNLMIGGVVAAVLVVLAVTFYFVTRSNDVVASAPGESDYGLAIGSPDATHDLVIYEDFLCPFCGELERATGTQIAALVESGDVYVDYRPFTLLDRVGTYSARATSAFGVVLDTSGPEVAKKFHDMLYADQPAEDAATFPDAAALTATAVAAGATEADVKDGIEAGETDFAKEATKEAFAAGVSGTPTIVLDGTTFTGSPDELLEALAK